MRFLVNSKVELRRRRLPKLWRSWLVDLRSTSRDLWHSVGIGPLSQNWHPILSSPQTHEKCIVIAINWELSSWEIKLLSKHYLIHFIFGTCQEKHLTHVFKTLNSRWYKFNWYDVNVLEIRCIQFRWHIW